MIDALPRRGAAARNPWFAWYGVHVRSLGRDTSQTQRTSTRECSLAPRASSPHHPPRSARPSAAAERLRPDDDYGAPVPGKLDPPPGAPAPRRTMTSSSALWICARVSASCGATCSTWLSAANARS